MKEFATHMSLDFFLEQFNMSQQESTEVLTVLKTNISCRVEGAAQISAGGFDNKELMSEQLKKRESKPSH